MKIATNVVEKLKQDAYLKAELVRVTGKSYPTISRWITNNDDMLTLKVVVDVIKEKYLLKEEQIFATQTETEKELVTI